MSLPTTRQIAAEHAKKHGGLNSQIFDKVLSLLRSSHATDVDTATKDLCETLESRKGQPEVDMACMELLVDVLLSTGDMQRLSKVLQGFTRRHERTQVRQVLTYIYESLNTLLALKDESDKSFLSSMLPCNNTQVTHFTNLLLQTSSALLQHGRNCAFGIEHPEHFITAANSILDLVQRHKLVDGLVDVFYKIKSYCDKLFFSRVASHDNGRRKVMNYQKDLFMLRLRILDIAIDLGHWNTVRVAMSEVSTMSSRLEEVTRNLNARKPNQQTPDVREMAPADHLEIGRCRFNCVAKAFLITKGWLFHAFASLEALLFENPLSEETMTKAVVAVLCVSRSIDDVATRSMLFADAEQQNIKKITATLNLNATPNRQTLFATTVPRLASASPAARALFQVVKDGTLNDLPALYRLLGELSQQPYLEPYMKQLELSMLEEFISTHFATHGSLDFAVFDRIKLLYPDSQDLYAIAVGRGATVDMMNRVAKYNTKESTLLNDVKSIVTKLNKALGAEVKRSARTPITITEADLAKEDIHINAVIQLHDKCLQRATTLEHDVKKRMQDAEEEKRKAKIKKEQEHHAKLQAERNRRLEQRVHVEEAFERRKQVLQRLKKNYRLTIPDSVAKDEDNFFSTVVQAVYECKRKAQDDKLSELRNKNYFFQALWERDIVARRQHAETMKVQRAKEREQRNQNYLEQHRAKYEESLAKKKALAVFLPSVLAYKEALKKEYKVPVSHRDEMNKNLDDYKAQLERAAREGK